MIIRNTMLKGTPNEIMNQKFILELNNALAMENAGVERLQIRVQEASLSEAKQKLQHHLQESQEHQKRLQQLISNIGGSPTQQKLGLPLPSYPQEIREMMESSMTKQEWELKRTEEDMIIENAEITSYLMLIHKAQMAGRPYLNAIEPLSHNMRDEENMVNWIKTASPGMLSQMWPKIQSVIASSSSQ